MVDRETDAPPPGFGEACAAIAHAIAESLQFDHVVDGLACAIRMILPFDGMGVWLAEAPDAPVRLTHSAGEMAVTTGTLTSRLSGTRRHTPGGRLMLFEIRNYHFNPDLLEGYKAWAKAEALPYLSPRLDIVGFWLKSNDPTEVGGEPQDKLGPANVTWIIRWRDLFHRNDVLPHLLSGPEWQDIRSRVPGGRASYLRTEAKFAEALL